MSLSNLICYFKGHDPVNFTQAVFTYDNRKAGKKKGGQKTAKRRKSFYSFDCARCGEHVKVNKQQQYELLYGRNPLKVFPADLPLTWIIGQVLGGVFIAVVIALIFLFV